MDRDVLRHGRGLICTLPGQQMETIEEIVLGDNVNTFTCHLWESLMGSLNYTAEVIPLSWLRCRCLTLEGNHIFLLDIRDHCQECHVIYNGCFGNGRNWGSSKPRRDGGIPVLSWTPRTEQHQWSHVFTAQMERWGRPEVNLFAARSNAQLPQYITRSLPTPTGGPDAFTMN
ncbi:hypothetical protein Hamer_G008161 [Homarus americanus]|uniref:Uncharacterized protein n=1 Tax=Homarus americanus TaxID=6706 RepID=A0A8J5TUP6_HOMAM|nr:hypothetical protein Hamer_G008161 [Homarus americanus]